MTVMQLHLTEQTTEQIRRVAARRKAKPEALIQELVERLVATAAGDSSLLGMFVQEPDLMAEIARDVVTPRQASTAEQVSWLGCMRDTGKITEDIIAPAEPPSAWEVLSS